MSAAVLESEIVALPPEPIKDLLHQADLVVLATVAEVSDDGPRLPVRQDHGVLNAGPIPAEPSQSVTLSVDRVLHGRTSETSLRVRKPVAPYLLRTGDRQEARAYFLTSRDSGLLILGLYGPGGYGIDEVLAELAAGKRVSRRLLNRIRRPR